LTAKGGGSIKNKELRMIKETPNPPNPADRAMDQNPKPDDSDSDPQSSTQLFNVTDSIDTETLLANLSETLASANAMLSDLAFNLEGSRRHVALGVVQMIELGELLTNKALDRVELRT
jgi:hypothetical protein